MKQKVAVETMVLLAENSTTSGLMQPSETSSRVPTEIETMVLTDEKIGRDGAAAGRGGKVIWRFRSFPRKVCNNMQQQLFP